MFPTENKHIVFNQSKFWMKKLFQNQLEMKWLESSHIPTIRKYKVFIEFHSLECSENYARYYFESYVFIYEKKKRVGELFEKDSTFYLQMRYFCLVHSPRGTSIQRFGTNTPFIDYRYNWRTSCLFTQKVTRSWLLRIFEFPLVESLTSRCCFRFTWG